MAALADGGAAVLTDGMLTVVDGAGQATAGVAMPLSNMPGGSSSTRTGGVSQGYGALCGC